MSNIYYRIDDRLIHGQVITAWSRYYKLERIIIVDDQVAGDPIQRQIINMVAPANIKVDVTNVEEGYKAIVDARKSETSTLVLVKGPGALCSLLERGIDLKEVIIGGMQFKDGRKKMTKTVAVNRQEAEEFWKLYDEQIQLIVQLVPTDRRSQIIPSLKRNFPKGG